MHSGWPQAFGWGRCHLARTLRTPDGACGGRFQSHPDPSRPCGRGRECAGNFECGPARANFRADRQGETSTGPPSPSAAPPRPARLERPSHPSGEGWTVNGSKYYCTGSLYAQWIELFGTGPEGNILTAYVPTSAPGLAQLDDWDGFGQRLTGSGTSTYSDVHLEPADVQPSEGRFRYQAAFYQTVHLATLTGIARAAARDVTSLLAKRTRTFSHAAAGVPRQDPQLLQVIGEVYAAAYAAGATTERVATSLERAAAAGHARRRSPNHRCQPQGRTRSLARADRRNKAGSRCNDAHLRCTGRVSHKCGRGTRPALAQCAHGLRSQSNRVQGADRG